jgi:GNAT superfamily N-acetyltransferase
MKTSIIKVQNPKPENNQIIRAGIIAFNDSILHDHPDQFSVYLKDENGTIHGGAVVWVHKESIYVDILWIDESLRHQGYGTKLMQAAEEEGKTRGCKYSTVDTYSFQAKDFYLKNGYQIIGEVKNYLFQYNKIFFRKDLGKNLI